MSVYQDCKNCFKSVVLLGQKLSQFSASPILAQNFSVSIYLKIFWVKIIIFTEVYEVFVLTMNCVLCSFVLSFLLSKHLSCSFRELWMYVPRKPFFLSRKRLYNFVLHDPMFIYFSQQINNRSNIKWQLGILKTCFIKNAQICCLHFPWHFPLHFAYISSAINSLIWMHADLNS